MATQRYKTIIKSTVFLGFIAIGFFLSAHVSQAAPPKTWTAASPSTWSTAGSWTPSGVPTSTDDVILSASSTQGLTIATDVNIKSITITSGYSGTITHSSGDIAVLTNGWSQAGGTFNGSASAADSIQVTGAFSLTGGTFKATAGDVVFYNSVTLGGTFQNNSGTVWIVAATGTITGSSTFYNLKFGGGNTYGPNQDNVLTVATGTILTVSNTFALDPHNGNVYLLGGGEIDAKGDVIQETDAFVLTDTNVPTSTFNLVINGTGTQTWTGETLDANAGSGIYSYFPSVTVNKPSGGVSLVGYIGVTGNFTNQNASSVFTPGTSTLMFMGASSTIIGSSTFNNIWLGRGQTNVSTTVLIATGTVLTAQGTVFFYIKTTSATPVTLLGGEIDVKGNIEAGETAYYAYSTTSMVLNGTSTQTIGSTNTCTSVAYGFGSTCGSVLFLPNPTITKTSGSIVLKNLINVEGNWTNTNATTIDPTTSTVVFGSGDTGLGNNLFIPLSFSWPSATGPSPATTTWTITGSSTFYNLLLGDTSAPASATIANAIGAIATGTILTVRGNFAPLANGNSLKINGGGEVDAQGDIIGQNNSGQYATSTISIVVNGTTTQFLGASFPAQGACGSACGYLRFPNLTISKASGTAYVNAASMSIFGPLLVSQGELSLATGTAAPLQRRLTGSVTVNSGAILSAYPGTVSTTLQMGSTFTNNGLVWFAGDGTGCSLPLPNYVIIQPDAGGTQSWSGSGTFVMRYVQLQNQSSSVPISLWNGVNNGGNSGFTFNTGLPRPQLIQSATASSASAATLALPTFSIKPRAGDSIIVAVSAKSQTIGAPTDNAGNSYLLAASTSFNSGTYALSIYYAKNINTTSSFQVTATGGAGGSPLSASVFEYTGMSPSSTLDTHFSTNTVYPATSTAPTSLSATGQAYNELYFGAMTLDASTTATSDPGWATELGITNNTTRQALYVEDQASTTILSPAASWTVPSSTSYTAILAIFRSPYASGYSASGTLDSATFDTGVTGGAQLNSVRWQGSQDNGTSVKFQIGVSNAPNPAWNFIGPDGTGNTYFSGSPNTSINLVSGLGGGGYNLFSGYRYFRYRVVMFSDPSFTYSPIVSQVVVNWSP